MSANFELKGSGTGAVDLVRRLNQQLDVTEKQGKQTAKQLEKMKLQAEKFAAQGDKVDQYNLKIKKLAEYVKKGALEQEHAEKAANRWRQQLDQVGKASDKAFGSQAISNLKSYVTGMIGITGIVAAVRAEITALRAEGNRIAQTKLDAAGARRVLRSQIALATPEEKRQVLSAADRLGADPSLGVEQKLVDLTLNSAVSASPNISRAIKFAQFGLQLTKGEGDVEAEIGGGLDIANALGSDDPVAAFAFLNAAKQVSRVESTGKVAKNLPRVVNAVKIAGADPRVGGALYAGLTVGGADPDSEVSRTAAINLIDRANKFFTQNKFKDIAAGDRDSFPEQLALLLGNDELSRQFLNSPQFQFRAASKPAVQQLFTPGSTAREAYAKFFEVIGEDPAATGRGMMDFINRGKFESAAQGERVIRKGAEIDRLAGADTLSEERVADLVALIRSGRIKSGLGNLSATDWSIRTELLLDYGATLEREEAAAYLEQNAAQFDWVSRRGSFSEANRAAAREQSALLTEMVNELRSINRKSNTTSSQQE